MKLLLSQKNTLFNRIEQMGFTAAQFEYIEGIPSNSKEYVVNIKFRAHPEFVFGIQDYSGGFYSGQMAYQTWLTPGQSSFEETHVQDHWNYVVGDFNSWLRYLEREVSQKDKWKELEEMSKTFDIALDSQPSDDKFTQKEYKLLERRIDELKTSLTSLGLNSEEINSLESKLDTLLERTKTTNKIDWYNLFVGYIVTFALDHALPPDTLHQLWQLIKTAFSGVLLLQS